MKVPGEAFALLGPGFFEDRQWRLFRPTSSGSATLWLATYEHAPQRLVGSLEPFTPQWSPPPAANTTFDPGDFEHRVEVIRQRIAAGDVYQVNLTVRAHLTGTEGFELLTLLCRRGIPRFAAWVRLDGIGELVSASPELLFETNDRWIHAEPMKGTAAPGERRALESSEKDRAELAMITDLTRNDLHQLCERGSVSVTAAQRIIELPYALQGVSDIEGQLRTGVTTEQIFATMHPGGSVTGAPRSSAMDLIRQLEPGPRRFYCGCLGVEVGDRCVTSLLIRTATSLGAGRWEYGVGSGITWDSDPHRELEEVRLKLGALSTSISKD